MITDIAVERVEFRCPKGHWQTSVDYHVVLYTDAAGDTWEVFSVDGVPTPSPYYVDGAPLCPVCHRAVPGRPVWRRFIPLPTEQPDQPRRRVESPETWRAQRSTEADGAGAGETDVRQSVISDPKQRS
jgi:hypothetical protein